MDLPVARSTLPSETNEDRFVVVKALPELRLTAQFRRLLLLSRKQRKPVELRIPDNCTLAKDLSEFLAKYESEFKVVRIPPVEFDGFAGHSGKSR